MAAIKTVTDSYNIRITSKVPTVRDTINLTDNTLLLLDEVDNLLIDKEVAILGQGHTNAVIGLTATAGD